MPQVFHEWALDEWQRRRWIGIAAVWLRAIVDLVRSVATQHVVRLREIARSGADSLRELASSPTLSSQLAQRRKLVVLGIGFAVINGLLWFATPALRAAVDASAGRLDASDRPVIVRGVQELLVYFDPWLAWYVFPVVFTIGFAVIPFLWIPRGPNPSGSATSFTFVQLSSWLLILLETVWLFLIWVGVWCRGPCWYFYWPSENWDATRVEVLHTVDLSNFFWTTLFGLPTHDMHWLVRELPGILILLAYFLLGFLLLTRKRRPQDRLWPLATATIVLLLAIAIPTKIFCRAILDLRYVVSLPEMQLNI